MPIFILARSMPMVRTDRAIRDFCVAKTCSTAERTFERAALARWRRRSIGLPLGLRKWIIDLSLARRIAVSFFAERYAVSAQTAWAMFSDASKLLTSKLSGSLEHGKGCHGAP